MESPCWCTLNAACIAPCARTCQFRISGAQHYAGHRRMATVSPDRGRDGMLPTMPNGLGRILSPARLVFVAASTGIGALAVNAAVRGELGVAEIAALSVSWY